MSSSLLEFYTRRSFTENCFPDIFVEQFEEHLFCRTSFGDWFYNTRVQPYSSHKQKKQHFSSLQKAIKMSEQGAPAKNFVELSCKYRSD